MYNTTLLFTVNNLKAKIYCVILKIDINIC